MITGLSKNQPSNFQTSWRGQQKCMQLRNARSWKCFVTNKCVCRIINRKSIILCGSVFLPAPKSAYTCRLLLKSSESTASQYITYRLVQIHYTQATANTLHTGVCKYISYRLVQIYYIQAYWRSGGLKIYDKSRAILITSSKTRTALVFLTLQIQMHL